MKTLPDHLGLVRMRYWLSLIFKRYFIPQYMKMKRAPSSSQHKEKQF
ncbi:hypothetical protein C163_09645 [Pseudomonas sp. FGI182]|nr:hypothetical protein C163_09645 [Pseudomonas sp. FGI182]